MELSSLGEFKAAFRARYIPGESWTEEAQEKFREVLHPDIKLTLLVQDYADFATLVNKAIQVETGLQEYKDSSKRNRDMGSSSGSSTQKRKIWIPNNMNHAPAPARGRPILHLCLLHHLGSEASSSTTSSSSFRPRTGCASSVAVRSRAARARQNQNRWHFHGCRGKQPQLQH
ncbi:hypothetical protein ZWY2020_006137 [Hordeum vulgare]|nr:hypothetical protein ZWY2020_006137 [Hordeum vulgare]